MKIGLRTKFASFFILFIIIIAGFIYYVSVENYRSALHERYGENAVSIGKTAATYVNAQIIRYYSSRVEVYNRKPKTDEKYEEMAFFLDQLKEASGVESIYIAKPVNDKKLMYIYSAKSPLEPEDEEKGYLGWVLNEYGDSAYDIAKEAMKTGEIQKAFHLAGQNGEAVAAAYIPIKNDNGHSMGFVSVEVSMASMDAAIGNLVWKMMKIYVAVIAFCFLILLALVQINVLSPIKRLKINVEAMAEGRLGVQTPVRGRDEVAEISSVFNRMSLNIAGHVKEIEELNQCYYRFVPFQIFHMIGKKSILEVNLGDQKNEEITICSMETQNFEEAVRELPTDEILNYMNDVLDVLIPAVSNEQGIIKNFSNAGLTAFYTESAERALSSAISACQEMDATNLGEKYGPFHKPVISAGITYGPAMIGIAGHEERLEATTVSEYTAMAGYLRRIAPVYHVRILITAKAAGQIKEFHKNYHSRFLGLLHNKAADTLEKLYDVFDGDWEEEKALKKKTKELFEQGVNYFCARDFYHARLAFIEVLKQFPKDAAARSYLYLCDQYCQSPSAEERDVCLVEF